MAEMLLCLIVLAAVWIQSLLSRFVVAICCATDLLGVYIWGVFFTSHCFGTQIRLETFASFAGFSVTFRDSMLLIILGNAVLRNRMKSSVPLET